MDKRNYNKKILVITRDTANIVAIEKLLKREGFEVTSAYTELSGVEKCRLEKPDMVLVETDLPGIDGLRISKRLKEDPLTRFVPIIALVDLPDALSGDVKTFEAEGYLLKPFNPELLKAEINRLMIRTVEQLSANPLTRLPGSITIEQNITDRIEHKEQFAVAYLDLNDFKPFNDYYGFAKGDVAIKMLAQLCVDASSKHGRHDDLVGHIGGDDFIMVTHPENADAVCTYIVENFDKEIKQLYEEADLQKGYITTQDRHFQVRNFSVMTVSIAVATNEQRELPHYGKVIDILVEMKKYVKSFKGKGGPSLYVKDRRKSDL